MKFEWDLAKADSNRKKHQVTFEEARSVFFDLHTRIIPDPMHSEDEQRLVALGMSDIHRLLVVAYCERGDRIRIISARKATRRERRTYEEQQDKGA